jgi:multiple sugar transport system permease protein
VTDAGVHGHAVWRRAVSASQRHRKTLLAYALIAPLAIGLLGFVYYPLLSSIGLSLTDGTLLEPRGSYVGLEQYGDVLGSERFWPILYQTVVYTGVSVLGSVVVGVLAAVWLKQSHRFTGPIRAIMLVPWVAPPIVTAFVWAYLYRDTGPIPQLLATVGLAGDRPVDFLTDRSAVAGITVAMLAVIQVGIWNGFPFVFLFSLAALSTIPEEVYEAARLDGAGPVAMFRSITLPLIAPVVETTALLLVLIRFGGVDLPFLLTGGGPGDTTMVFGVLIYNTAFSSLDTSAAAALGMTVFMLMLPVSILYVVRVFRQTAA